MKQNKTSKTTYNTPNRLVCMSSLRSDCRGLPHEEKGGKKEISIAHHFILAKNIPFIPSFLQFSPLQIVNFKILVYR